MRYHWDIVQENLSRLNLVRSDAKRSITQARWMLWAWWSVRRGIGIMFHHMLRLRNSFPSPADILCAANLALRCATARTMTSKRNCARVISMPYALYPKKSYPIIFPATCFRRASSWSMIPAEVVRTIYPNWREGSSLTTHFSKSVIRTLYRGEITPVLLMLLQGYQL